MIRRPARDLGIDPAEPKLGQIEFVDKDIDHPNRIVLTDPVFQAFRKQRACTRSAPSTKRFIRSSRKSRENLTAGIKSSDAFSRCSADVRRTTAFIS
jgi:hypothetical protein